jgi:hypothetical protein
VRQADDRETGGSTLGHECGKSLSRLRLAQAEAATLGDAAWQRLDDVSWTGP